MDIIYSFIFIYVHIYTYICRGGWQAGDSGKSCSLSPKSV